GAIEAERPAEVARPAQAAARRTLELAAREVAPPVPAAASTAEARPAPATPPADPAPATPPPAPAPAPVDRAVALLAASALAPDPGRVAPAAGPRVLLPAGLGGAVAAARASRAVHRPASAAPALPAQAAPAERARPAALDHLVWSDRWLARFAGASAPALGTFDAARTRAPAARASAWQPSFLQGASRPARPAGQRARLAPEQVLAAPVFDDDAPVSDDVFSAIAAAAAAERRGRSARPRPAGPQEPTGRFRRPAADRALSAVEVGRTAGLGSALGASPVAPLLSSMLEVAPQPAYDPRQVSPLALPQLLARAAAAGAAPQPGLRRLAGSAPASVWVAPPQPGTRAPRPEPAERPGGIGAGAEAFARARAATAADLSLDFVTPE